MSGQPPFMDLFGFRIDSADAREVVLRMDVPDVLMSPFGAVLGGAIATLFDTGLAIAITRQLAPVDRIATHSLTVTYVAFAEEPRLICRAHVVSVRHAVAVAEGEVATAGGTLVAKALGTFGIRRAAPQGA